MCKQFLLTLVCFPLLFLQVTIARRKRIASLSIPVTRQQARRMAEQAKTDEQMATRIAELEELAKSATERATKAEKERDEAIAEFPPGFDPSQMMGPSSSTLSGPTGPLAYTIPNGQWKWVNPLTSPDANTNPNPKGETITNMPHTTVNPTIDLGQGPVHQDA